MARVTVTSAPKPANKLFRPSKPPTQHIYPQSSRRLPTKRELIAILAGLNLENATKPELKILSCFLDFFSCPMSEGGQIGIGNNIKIGIADLRWDSLNSTDFDEFDIPMNTRLRRFTITPEKEDEVKYEMVALVLGRIVVEDNILTYWVVVLDDFGDLWALRADEIDSKEINKSFINEGEDEDVLAPKYEKCEALFGQDRALIVKLGEMDHVRDNVAMNYEPVSDVKGWTSTFEVTGGYSKKSDLGLGGSKYPWTSLWALTGNEHPALVMRGMPSTV
jgi:hypothetical protein